MRNKGIVIELTALLDVILIMLFWVMMSMEKNNEKVRSDAAAQVAQAEQKYQDSLEQLEVSKEEYDILRSEFDTLLDATSESAAVANQKALNEFANGNVLVLKIKYTDYPVIYVYNGSEELGHSVIESKAGAYEQIISSIKKLGLTEKDSILCLFIYDGSTTARFDANYIREAMDDVRLKYSRFYCTYTSTSR